MRGNIGVRRQSLIVIYVPAEKQKKENPRLSLFKHAKLELAVHGRLVRVTLPTGADGFYPCTLT